jgi:hypothetical protein
MHYLYVLWRGAWTQRQILIDLRENIARILELSPPCGCVKFISETMLQCVHSIHVNEFMELLN